jgi:hypothetical protein
MKTTVLKSTLSVLALAGCLSATNAQCDIAFDYLNVNNIKATINSNGHLFGSLQNIPENEKNGFEIKNADGKHTVRIAGLWMLGKEGTKYHIYAPTFGVWGRDVYQGIVMKPEFYSSKEDDKWNRVWKVSKEMIKNHIANFASKEYVMDEVIANWPASGDISKGQSPNLAPFVDVNSNGIYDPNNGDYPSIKGDEAILFIYNDHRNQHTESIGTYPMGVEVIGMAYAFNNGFSKVYNNTVFVDFTVINRSGIDYTDAKLGVFTDIDMGAVTTDDYQGFDTKRNTYYGYNAPTDKASEKFGRSTTPYMSITLLNEPFSGFMTYNNDCDINGNPIMPTDYYCYLNGYWKDGMPTTKGGNGKGGNVHCSYMYDGNPNTGEGWTEKAVNNTPGDRRGLGLVGPFDFKAGYIKKISVAYNFSGDFETMQNNADKYSNDFKNNAGPFAPEAITSSKGISDKKPIDMIMYPNPANTSATLSFSNPGNEQYSVNVYDITGRKLISENQLTGSQYQVNTSKLEKGLYVVELLFKDRRNSSRLVIQ